ncbi:MAG: hypothetical protein ACKO6K_01130, partial [Chitinophagaceae bacterium]
SNDSIRNFKTIETIPSPGKKSVDYLDRKARPTSLYYRLFIVYPEGSFEFTDVITLEGSDASSPDVTTRIPPAQAPPDFSPPPSPEPVTAAPPEQLWVVKTADQLLSFQEKAWNLFRDSILNTTKDTLLSLREDTFLLKPYVAKESNKPSAYVFVSREGNVIVKLPEASRKKYALDFYDAKNQYLFRITQFRDSPLIIDKANFLESGWYYFDLFEEGKLKEKNKLFLPKDF